MVKKVSCCDPDLCACLRLFDALCGTVLLNNGSGMQTVPVNSCQGLPTEEWVCTTHLGQFVRSQKMLAAERSAGSGVVKHTDI